MPVTLLNAHGKKPPRRVCVVITWLTELLDAAFSIAGKLGYDSCTSGSIPSLSL